MCNRSDKNNEKITKEKNNKAMEMTITQKNTLETSWVIGISSSFKVLLGHWLQSRLKIKSLSKTYTIFKSEKKTKASDRTEHVLF